MRSIDEHDALIVADVQGCFLPGGSLGIEGGDAVIPVINRLVPRFRHHVFSRDWHPAGHVSFADDPEFRDLSWPVHCVQGTAGAELDPSLDVPDGALLVNKGTNPDREAYSAFQTEDVDLATTLRAAGVERVFVTGLATDYCVRATALDARRAGFDVVVVEDAARGVSPDTVARALADMDEAGVERVQSQELE